MKVRNWAVVTACLVIYTLNQRPSYKDLDYQVIKELRKLVKESGVSAYHVLNYLESISNAYVLTPSDWRNVMKMILSMTWFMVRLTDYRDLCATQAETFQCRDPPVVVTQLTGGATCSCLIANGLSLGCL